MAKKLLWLVTCSCLLVAAGVLLAQESNDFGVEWDEEAVQAMSREERLAYQRQYKTDLEEAARLAGAIPTGAMAGKAVGRTAQVPRIPGTAISYHSGTLSGSAVSSFSIGNQFDSALTGMGAYGPVEMSGSITMVTVDMASVSGNAFVSFFDQLAGATANVITSISTGPMVAGVNTLNLATPINYVGTSFLAGVWNFGSDVVNVATGTVGGQGYHGMQINDLAGTGFVTYAQTNGAVAVQGNVATPVELLSFEIVD